MGRPGMVLSRGRATVGLLAIVAVLPACSAAASAGGSSGQVWRTDGYGLVYELAGEQLKTYEITDVSCLPAQTLQQTEPPGPDGTLGYGDGDTTTQILRREAPPGDPAPPGTATVHLVGTAADMDLKPLPSLPAACTRQVPPDPVSTFDVFWSTIAENYNSLGRKHIDWTAIRDLYRPRVSADTSPEQLFRILQAMIEPF